MAALLAAVRHNLAPRAVRQLLLGVMVGLHEPSAAPAAEMAGTRRTANLLADRFGSPRIPISESRRGVVRPPGTPGSSQRLPRASCCLWSCQDAAQSLCAAGSRHERRWASVPARNLRCHHLDFCPLPDYSSRVPGPAPPHAHGCGALNVPASSHGPAAEVSPVRRPVKPHASVSEDATAASTTSLA